MGFTCKIFGHKWYGCKCIRCSTTRNEGHEWSRCKCSRCGKEISLMDIVNLTDQTLKDKLLIERAKQVFFDPNTIKNNNSDIFEALAETNIRVYRGKAQFYDNEKALKNAVVNKDPLTITGSNMRKIYLEANFHSVFEKEKIKKKCIALGWHKPVALNNRDKITEGVNYGKSEENGYGYTCCECQNCGVNDYRHSFVAADRNDSCVLKVCKCCGLRYIKHSYVEEILPTDRLRKICSKCGLIVEHALNHYN